MLFVMGIHGLEYARHLCSYCIGIGIYIIVSLGIIVARKKIKCWNWDHSFNLWREDIDLLLEFSALPIILLHFVSFFEMSHFCVEDNNYERVGVKLQLLSTLRYVKLVLHSPTNNEKWNIFEQLYRRKWKYAKQVFKYQIHGLLGRKNMWVWCSFVR